MLLQPYRSIVVGTDGSSLAGPTVERAAREAARDDADLTIICAYSAVSRRVDAMNVATLGGDPFVDQVPGHEAARQSLDQALAIANECGARVVLAQLVDADAVAALLLGVQERQADLLVIGAIRDTSIAGRLLGTVAEEVVRKAACDVLIVRPRSGDPEPSRPEDAD